MQFDNELPVSDDRAQTPPVQGNPERNPLNEQFADAALEALEKIQPAAPKSKAGTGDELQLPAFDYSMLPPALAGYVRTQAERLNCAPEQIIGTLLALLSALIGANITVRPQRRNTAWRIPAKLSFLSIAGKLREKCPPPQMLLDGIFETQEARGEKLPRGTEELILEEISLLVFPEERLEAGKYEKISALYPANIHSLSRSDTEDDGTGENSGFANFSLPVALGAVVENELRMKQGGSISPALLRQFDIVFYPPAPEWRLCDEAPDEAQCAALRKTLLSLAALAAGLAAPRTLHFSAEGQEYFNDWWTDLETAIRRAAEHPDYLDFKSRSKNVLSALALVFELWQIAEKGASLSEDASIGIDAVRWAARFCAALDAHAQKVFDQLLRPEQKTAKLILERLYVSEFKKRAFGPREIMRKWTCLGDSKMVKEALAWLADIGRLVRVPTTPSAKGGAAPLLYILAEYAENAQVVEQG